MYSRFARSGADHRLTEITDALQRIADPEPKIERLVTALETIAAVLACMVPSHRM
jgi:hypothetical protein